MEAKVNKKLTKTPSKKDNEEEDNTDDEEEEKDIKVEVKVPKVKVNKPAQDLP